MLGFECKTYSCAVQVVWWLHGELLHCRGSQGLGKIKINNPWGIDRLVAHIHDRGIDQQRLVAPFQSLAAFLGDVNKDRVLLLRSVVVGLDSLDGLALAIDTCLPRAVLPLCNGVRSVRYLIGIVRPGYRSVD